MLGPCAGRRRHHTRRCQMPSVSGGRRALPLARIAAAAAFADILQLDSPPSTYRPHFRFLLSRGRSRHFQFNARRYYFYFRCHTYDKAGAMYAKMQNASRMTLLDSLYYDAILHEAADTLRPLRAKKHVLLVQSPFHYCIASRIRFHARPATFLLSDYRAPCHDILSRNATQNIILL